MTSADTTALRRRALACLSKGSVSIKYVRTSAADVDVYESIVARVTSSQPDKKSSLVQLRAGAWLCTCGDVDCKHIYAVQQVTTGAPE